MKKLRNLCILFPVGAIGYPIIEIIFRGYTHWSMSLTGGIVLPILVNINNVFKTLPSKCLVGSFFITAIEFIVGCFVNLKWNMKVWDYSNLPFNILGQVCLPFSLTWAALCIPVYSVCNKISNRSNKNLKLIETNADNK